LNIKRPRDPKRLGHESELAFLLKASRHGFDVLKPFTESTAYDFVVNRGKKFHRVQVKSTHMLQGHSYRIHAVRGRHRRIRYTAHSIDFLCIYIAPEDVWYIIPIRKVRRRCLLFKPHAPHKLNLWEPYREAWHLLQ